MVNSALAVLLLLSQPVHASDVAPGYQPQDKDERGLWMVMDEEERKLRASNFIMRDPGINAYVRQVFCRTVGEAQCAPVRIYLVRTPQFNASMAPNGMMVVWSGLLLRIRDEAQLATVLGHEFTHYRNRHSLQLWREAKQKSDAVAWLAIIPVANLAALGAIAVVQYGLIGSLYAFSRDMEREADIGSVELLAKAGYDPMAASRIWEQIRTEMDATAAARNKKSKKDKSGGLFATHPPTAERMADLKALAAKQPAGELKNSNRAEFRKAMKPYWPDLIDDQVKLNDFGGTEMLLNEVAKDEWTPELLYARGELYRSRGQPEDLKKAAEYYGQATTAPDAPVEAWRGLGLALIRSGAQAEGRNALKEYLARKSDATDRAMIAMLAGEKQ